MSEMAGYKMETTAETERRLQRRQKNRESTDFNNDNNNPCAKVSISCSYNNVFKWAMFLIISILFN